MVGRLHLHCPLFLNKESKPDEDIDEADEKAMLRPRLQRRLGFDSDLGF
jgi:hypothetical protein